MCILSYPFTALAWSFNGDVGFSSNLGAEDSLVIFSKSQVVFKATDLMAEHMSMRGLKQNKDAAFT